MNLLRDTPASASWALWLKVCDTMSRHTHSPGPGFFSSVSIWLKAQQSRNTLGCYSDCALTLQQSTLLKPKYLMKCALSSGIMTYYSLTVRNELSPSFKIIAFWNNKIFSWNKAVILCFGNLIQKTSEEHIFSARKGRSFWALTEAINDHTRPVLL